MSSIGGVGMAGSFVYSVFGFNVAYDIAKLILQMFILDSDSFNNVSPMYG